MSVIVNNAYFNLDGSLDATLSTIDKVSGGSNLTSVINAISPQPSDYSAQFTITNEYGKNIGWISATLDGTETVDGDTWNKWKYPIRQSDLAEVSRLGASKAYFQFRWREQDNEYIGAYTTTSTVEDTINAELKTEYSEAVEDNWVLVTDGNADTTSYEFDGTDWNNLSYEKPIYPNVYTSDVVEISITPTIYASESTLTNSELVIITAWLTELTNDIIDIQNSLKDTSDGSFDPTADDEWSSDKRTYNYLNGTYNNLGLDFDIGTLDVDTVNVGTKSITDNVAEQTLDIELNTSVTGQMFQEELTLARNNTGSTITNGQVVYISGSSGTIAEISLATNTDKAKAHSTIGIATQEIPNNTSGFVNRGGLVRGVDTTAYPAGTMLYLGVNGAFTSTKPTPPTYLVEIGIVVKSGGAGVGSILTNIEKVHEIAEAPDVFNDSPSNDDILVYDAVNEYYKSLPWRV